MRIFPIFAALLLAAAPALAQTPQEHFDKANEAYLNEDHEAAIEHYDKVLDAGIVDADAYFNLANAYFKAGKVGYAILYYEKALRLAPGDEDIQYNLEQARARNVDKVVDAEGGAIGSATASWDRFFNGFSANTITVVFALLYLLFFGLLFAARFVRDPRLKRNLIVANVPVAVFALCAGLLFAGKIYTEEFIPLGVVVAQEVGVKEGPDRNFKTAFEVHEGLKVRVRERRAQWSKVSLMNGLTGWIPNEAFEPI